MNTADLNTEEPTKLTKSTFGGTLTTFKRKVDFDAVIEPERISITDRITFDSSEDPTRIKLIARRFGIEEKKQEKVNVSYFFTF